MFLIVSFYGPAQKLCKIVIFSYKTADIFCKSGLSPVKIS